MLRWSWRPAFFVLIVIVLASCSGAGGCSGCSGCGMTPLAAGFPQASVIPNAASVRVTRPGLDFISANLGTVAGKALGTSGGTITFNVPDTKTSFTVIFTINVEICKTPVSNGQCVADINIGGAKLNVDSVTFTPASGGNAGALSINGTVPVKADDIPVQTSLGNFDIGLGNPVNGNGCGGPGGGPSVDYADVPISVTLPIVAETIAPRDGYSKIDTAHATINATVSPNIVQICNGGFLGGFLNLIKGFIVQQITGPLTSTLQNQLQSQLCTKPNTMVQPPCPDGTESGDAGSCVFQSSPSTCVPTLLGLDGHMDLGTLIQKYSPGNAASVDLVLAAAGNSDPAPGCAANDTWSASGGCAADPKPPYTGHTPNGLTLGMLGGMLPSPQTGCVPIAPNPLPTGIPIPDELMTDPIAPWPMGDNGPDLDLAIAGRFINYAATSAYNSGVLCLGVSTAQVPAISTGYISAVVPSLRDLTFEPGKQSKPAAMAITTRPQKPPVITLGNGTDIKKDPLLSVLLPQFAIDFYAWSEDRFVRVFTFTGDLTIPIDLQTGKDPKTNPNGGILPVLGSLNVANGKVTNSDLVFEDPVQLAGALQSLLGGIVGQLLGNGFSPISLSSALAKFGLDISIPAGGFRKLTKGSDDYLALFADLTTTTGAAMREIDTQARILGREVHPEAMSLGTIDPAKFPKLQVQLSSPQDNGTRPVEYTWWIDEQPHAAWTTSREITVDTPYLFLQGKHVLYASSRVVGHPESEDSTPAEVPFLIDVIAPYVWLDSTQAGLTAGAYDFVSDLSAMTARYRTADASGAVGEWTAWQPVSSLPVFSQGSSVELQVMDEAGNVGDVNGLIRGRPDPTLAAAGSACGCSTPGASPGPRTGLLASLAVIAALAVFAMRRRRAAAMVVGSLGVLAASSQGCSCGSSNNNNNQPPGQTGCGDNCNQPCGSPNALGLIGAYTSVAVAGDGTIWVAGYNDADVSNALLYGDLVVGKYDSGKQQVQWQTVDGLPPARTDGTCPPNDPTTWRHGETDPGPDVGLWTSIQIGGSGNPMVSYYDATNAALKFASSPDGGRTWQSHTVMQAAHSDMGRYSKMVLVNGSPVVAFLVEEPGMGGWARSRVVLATANNASPQSAGDWTFQDTVVDEQTPCRALFCSSGQSCVQMANGDALCQNTVNGCTPADCGASTAGIGSTTKACVTDMGKATCDAVLDTTHIDTYPDTTGDYVTMANGPQGIGIVVYDRTRGNLVGVANQGGKWNAQILDGQTGSNTDPMRVDTGDVGVGASLAITSEGDWHISYVNGWTEALQYLTVPGGNLMKPFAPEVVDNGATQNGQAGGTPYPDGQHVIGDDSSVTVDSGGAVRIVYQDATSGTLREATGTPGSGGKHTWTSQALAQQGRFAGFFPHYVPQAQAVANWFRATDHTQSPPVVSGDVAFVSP